MSSFNLSSPTQVSRPCDPDRGGDWAEGELALIESEAIRETVSLVLARLDEFVKFANTPILLWEGCDRIPLPGKKQRYHKYPTELKKLALAKGVTLDTRPNGPAIASFLFGGGDRPMRSGSTNAWSIHHIYSGKYPYLGKKETVHAAKAGLHFSQSAGLIAAHPIADAISDEFPFFAWLLRARAFKKFGYDPDRVFGKGHDRLGFVGNEECQVVYRDMA